MAICFARKRVEISGKVENEENKEGRRGGEEEDEEFINPHFAPRA
jgi:hypothetical protein